MKWRKLNRNVHRDLGYLFVGLTLIYAISGIALNHLHHWNPDYIKESYSANYSKDYDFSVNREATIQQLLDDASIDYPMKSNILGTDGELKVFFDLGSGSTGKVVIYPDEKYYFVDIQKKRSFFFELDLMHRNNFKKIWTWVSDIYAIGLILLAITGMIILRGKKGFKKYGVWWVAAGIVIPVIILIYFS
ncbi:MAG: hypothetical protein C0599_14945 [Salinivirgaceae bacterium]|nr:MAG: hypothetical protein C0599_14945 [Salinivirgaceae bacterium]